MHFMCKLDMYFRNMDAPAATKLKSGKISKSHILTRPTPRDMWCQGSVSSPLSQMNLQSKFGYLYEIERRNPVGFHT